MELKTSQRKGFVYTLEAVIAATLFLGMVIVVIPNVEPGQPSRTVQNTIHDALGSLEKTSGLEDKTRSEIDGDLDEFLPAGYKDSVRTSEVNTETHSATAPDEFHLDKNGNHTEIQFWIQNANNLEATYRGEKILDTSSSGYKLKSVDSSTGWLNFTGTGELVFDFDVYSSNGNIPDKDDLKSVNYVTGEKEIQVFIWKD